MREHELITIDKGNALAVFKDIIIMLQDILKHGLFIMLQLRMDGQLDLLFYSVY